MRIVKASASLAVVSVLFAVSQSAARVEVVANCELRREDTCLDRVRIVELAAQPPAPNNRWHAGDDFFLISGHDQGEQLPVPAPQLVLFAIPMSNSDEPAGYGAMILDVRPDSGTLEALRVAIASVFAEKH